MSDFCEYKVRVRGKKNACYAFAGSMPCADKKDWSVVDNDKYCEMFIRGDCIGNVDNNSVTWNGNSPVQLSNDIGSAFEEGQDKYWNISLRERSKAFDVEVWCSSLVKGEKPCQIYNHYNAGVSIADSCPEDLAFDLDGVQREQNSQSSPKTPEDIAVKYKPGEEPEEIKPKLHKILQKLSEAYPDRIVVSFNALHKKLAEKTRELVRFLGYKSSDDFLNAYGFSIRRSGSGRPKSDLIGIIDTLKERYPNGTDFGSADDLFRANPEFLSKLKTLKNSSNELFGMPFGAYLKSIGLLKQLERNSSNLEKSAKTQAKQIEYDLCTLDIPGMKQPIFALKTTYRIRKGDYVKVGIGFMKQNIVGIVRDIVPFRQEMIDFPEDKLPIIDGTVSALQYRKEMIRNILCVNAVGTAGELLSKSRFVEFTANTSEINSTIWDGGSVTAMCCRGLAFEIMSAADFLVKSEPQIYSYNDVVFTERGIAEMLVFGGDANKILKRYPNLKASMFIEDPNNKTVSAGYSQSGYDSVTDCYVIGEYDPLNENRWSLTHSPAEKAFSFGDDNMYYNFRHIEDWLALNYVFDLNGVSMKMEDENI